PCTPGLLLYHCSARCCLRPRGLVSHSPWRALTHGLRVGTISRHPNCPVLGAMCQIEGMHPSPRRTPTATAAVPGGWIDLTREGFCYAKNVGILSFSVVAQSLVN